MKDSKECKKHGYVSGNQVRWEKSGKQGLVLRCVQCKLDKDRKWKANNWDQHKASAGNARKANRGRVNEYIRMDRKRNPDKYKKWDKDYRDKNRERIRKQEICRVHGLKLDQYEQMIIDQDNKCYICGKEEQTRGRGGDIMPLCVDHCHKSEAEGNYKVRKLLCRMCNQGIGFFKDDIDLMKKIISYIEEHTKDGLTLGEYYEQS